MDPQATNPQASSPQAIDPRLIESLTPQAPSLSAEVSLLVRYAECDPLGIVYHSNYFIFFEMARTQQMKDAGFTYIQMTELGAFVVMSEIGAKFRAPARYDDTLVIRATLDKVSSMRIQHVYEILKVLPDGTRQHLGEGHSTLACVNREGELIPVPTYIREFYARGKAAKG